MQSCNFIVRYRPVSDGLYAAAVIFIVRANNLPTVELL